MQKASCEGFSGARQSITWIDTSHQRCHEQMQHDCNSVVSRRYQHIRVYWCSDIIFFDISNEYEIESIPTDLLIPSDVDSQWKDIPVDSVTVTILQHNNPDTVVVQKARCVEKWHGQGNWFNSIMIEGDRAPWNNCRVRHQGYCPAKLLNDCRFSDRLNTREANANGCVMWWTLHPDLLFIEDWEYRSSAMPNGTDGMIMCWDAPQWVRHIVDVSSVYTPMQLVPSGEDNQYLLNQYASMESYNMIY